VGIESMKLAEWARFVEVLGFGTRDSESDVLHLCIDRQHHRLAVHRGEREALAYLGWDVGSVERLEAMRERLEQADLVVEVGKDELCEERRVSHLVTVDDPCGFRHELFSEPLIKPRPFQPGRPMVGGFVTGTQGMGHVVLAVPDLQAARDFFCRLLGFHKSDWAGDASMAMEFFHSNPRHHSVAFLEFPGMRGLQHLMVEVEELDDVGIALDLCQEEQHPISISLGRHHNDRIVSFYVRSPSGFDIEYGWGAIHVDDATWSTGRYDEPSLWGHKFDPQNLAALVHPIEAQ
jgi:extradiol dioxygenase